MSGKKVVASFDVPADAYDKFDAQAGKEGKSFAKAVQDAMRDYLAQRGIQADFVVEKQLADEDEE
jgi:hypothetical protein